MKENVGRLLLQLLFDERNPRRIRAARVQEEDGSVTTDIDYLPAKKLHEEIARIHRRHPRKKRRNDFLNRKFVRPGQDEARRTLLQE